MTTNIHVDAYLARVHSAFGDVQDINDMLAYATIESERDCHVIIMTELRAHIFAIANYNVSPAQARVLIDRVDDILMLLCESDMMPVDDATHLIHFMYDLSRIGFTYTGQFIETMQTNAPSDEWLNAVIAFTASMEMRDAR